MSRRRRIGSGAGGAWWSANTLLVVLSGILPARSIAQPPPLKPHEISLNGTWSFRPWGGAETTIPVPEFWDAAPGFRVSRAAYWRTVTVPPEWEGRRIHLEFQSVHFAATVYVNDRLAGEHVGAWIPFALDITNRVAPGTPFTLRVEVGGGDQAPVFDGGVQWPIGYRGRTRQWGIGGDVWVRAYGPVHVSEAAIRTSVTRGEVAVEYIVMNATNRSQTVRLEADVLEATGGQLARPLEGREVRLEPGRTRGFTLTTAWPDAKQWTPDSPHLYLLRTRLWQDSAIVDEETRRFGFREITIRGTQFYLNGIRTNLFGDNVMAHSENFARAGPAARYGMMTRETWPRHLEQRFELNNRYLRFHPQPPPRFVFDLADEKGLLILAEAPLSVDAYDDYLPLGASYFTNALRWMDRWVRSVRNHPSIVLWSTCNEFGPPYAILTAQQVKQLQDVVRAADGTRPVISDGDGDTVPGADAVNYHYPEGYTRSPPGERYPDWRALLHPEKPTGIGELLTWYGDHGAANQWWQGTWTRRLRYLNFTDVRLFTFDWVWADPDSPKARHLRRSLAPVALFDKGYDELGIGPLERQAYPSVRPGATVDRVLVLYNDEWEGTSLTVGARIVRNGVETDVLRQGVMLALGEHMEIPYRFRAPEAGPFDLVLTVSKNGRERFRESLRFVVSEKSPGKGGDPEQTGVDSRAAFRSPP